MDLMIIEWVDSSELCGWTFVEDVPKCAPKKIRTAGFIVERSSAGIVIAASVDKAEEQVCGTMTIPQSAIISMKPLSAITIEP